MNKLSLVAIFFIAISSVACSKKDPQTAADANNQQQPQPPQNSDVGMQTAGPDPFLNVVPSGNLAQPKVTPRMWIVAQGVPGHPIMDGEVISIHWTQVQYFEDDRMLPDCSNVQVQNLSKESFGSGCQVRYAPSELNPPMKQNETRVAIWTIGGERRWFKIVSK